MKIIGRNTSPREGSNVRIALENALEASKAKGAENDRRRRPGGSDDPPRAGPASRKRGWLPAKWAFGTG